jgi:glycogen(starch) synthase
LAALSDGAKRKVKILMVSYAFAPQVGGVESVGQLFAQRWAEAGHEVVVVTATKGSGADPNHPYIVIREPSFWKLWHLLGWADVFFQNNLTLRFFWPWVLRPRPFYLTHHIWIGSVHGAIPGVVAVKQTVAMLATNIAISSAIAKGLWAQSMVIGSPYDENRFWQVASCDVVRPKDFLFVGRLVSGKAVDVFLRALGRMRQEGLLFTATVAGDGPAREGAEAMTKELQLGDRLEFKGVVRDQALVETYRSHRVLVVPSRWEEPFGVVALEGLASGCQLVVANVGGLPEAAGPTARIFPKDDWMALSEILKSLPNRQSDEKRALIKMHLRQHASATIAKRYSEMFASRV